MGTVRDVYLKLVRVIKCKSCGRALSSRVTTCESGHTACESCYNELDVCGACGTDFSSRCNVFYTKVVTALQDKNSFLDKLFELMECPVCYENLSRPSWTCWNGHVTCGRCYFFTNSCPLCREEFADLYCADINSLLSVLEEPIDCLYKPYGCDIKERYNELRNHETLCRYRQYECMIPGCRFVGFLREISGHVASRHPKRFLRTDQHQSLHLEIFRDEKKVVMVASGGGFYWLEWTMENCEVGIRLTRLGRKCRPSSASLDLGYTRMSVPISSVSETTRSPIVTCRLDPRIHGKSLNMILSLEVEGSSWPANLLLIAALAANLTFFAFVLQKNIQ